MPSNILRSTRLIASVLTFAAIVCLSGTTPSAQYFGRNKVQYKKLDFQVLKTEHFDIYFYPDEREGIDIAARLAERWRVRLERLLNHELSGRQTLILYASHPDFEQTNAIQGELGEGTGGVTESVKRRVILPLGGPIADTDHVLGHELVHAFQFDMVNRPGTGRANAERLPLWFIEGMAEYFSIGPVDSNTAMWLRDAVRQEESHGKLPAVKDLDNPKYFPYRWGQAFWAYVGGKWGDAVIGEMLDIAGSSGDIELAIRRTLGVNSKDLSEEWHASIRRAYAATTDAPENIGSVVIKGDGANALNVGPAISPDGRWIAFLSERGLLSIDLFVADAATGRVVRKLTSTASNPHYSSIQFIMSAGAWDADSKRIAIGTIASGRPALAIFNAQTGDKESEYKLKTLDEIFNPTWAPDGHAVAFTGMSRGLTDLYVLDLKTSELRQLTHDAFADLQPSWSPDGRRIAFATDRFSSDLPALNMGTYRIAFIDPQGGSIQQASAFTDGKNINPQGSPDSASVLFISDRDGVPNLYRVSIPGGAVQQLTNARTGLSGITSTSPALSVASRAGVAAFSVYTNGGYNIHTLQLGATPSPDASVPSTSRVDLSPASSTAAVLPPLDRRASEVSELLTNPTLGLPPAQDNEVQGYKSKLGLEEVGRPQFAVGASRFGAAVAGGITFSFGDVLGDQHVDTTVQFSSGFNGNFSIKDTAAAATYLNQAHRWTWGVGGSQIPYSSGGIQQNVGVIENQPALIEQTIIFRQTERGAMGLVAYPFNRVQRVEFTGGLTQLSFDQIVQTRAFNLNTGNNILDNTDASPFGDTLNLATSTAALVYDAASFGATSPVQGQRYRLEASPTFGTVAYTGVLADYRRYFMPASFYTIAARALHYGRYGSGGDDTRLIPLYLGYPSLVRGYDVNTFDATDCVPTASSECPIFDRLIGSRMLVGNLEFRFPLLRPFGASPSKMYGPVPVEVALFADGGVAWSASDKPSFLGGERKGISSVGAAVRVNMLGFAIGEFDWSRPLQRVGRGWIFQFNLAPGF